MPPRREPVAVATISAEPTQENIQRVASQLDADDRWRSGEVIRVLDTLIKENYVDDINQLNAIKAIVETLQRTSSYQARHVVDAGEEKKMIPGSVEPVPDAPRSSAPSAKPDNDWT